MINEKLFEKKDTMREATYDQVNVTKDKYIMDMLKKIQDHVFIEYGEFFTGITIGALGVRQKTNGNDYSMEGVSMTLEDPMDFLIN